MPRGLRPKLQRSQVDDLALCHNTNFDAIVRGDADWLMMWDFVGSVLTWWRVAHVLQAGMAEMDEQMLVATRLVKRYAEHGVVRFDGPDMKTARDGVAYMDQLAELVDKPTAMEATAWAEGEVQRMAAGVQQRPLNARLT